MAAEALASLPPLNEATLAGVVMVSGPRGEPVEVAQLQPTNRAADAFRAIVTSAADSYKECEVIDYDPAAVAVGDQVMWMDLSTLPLLQAIVRESADVANLDEFDPEAVKVANVRLTAIRMVSGRRATVLVQALPQGQLATSNKRFGVLVRRGRIDVPREPVFLLGRDVLAITDGTYVFFSDRRAFQKLFGLLAEIEAQAERTFQEMTEKLQIDGIDRMLVAVTGSPSMLGKMASIQRKLESYPEYKKAMTMPNLLKFVRLHPECGVELSGDGPWAKLVFRNDPQHRFKILRLLDDDLLRSELTSFEYEANSKSPPLR
jgi:Domain of unknown function (DUF4868)